MYTYSFEKLDAWKRSRELALKIYNLSRQFPPEEKFGLISQMRRAVISVCSNLAEGSARIKNKDKKQFYTIAYSSLMELLNQLLICSRLGWINENILLDFRPDFDFISNKINSLRNSIPDND